MKRKTKLLRLVMLCMLMLFSASEMWAGTTFTVNVKCEPTGVAKVYAKYETDENYAENQNYATIDEDYTNFYLKYDNLQEGYTFLGWSKGAPSTKASDMVSTDQVATVTVPKSDPTVTYYANFSDGSKFKITEDASISEHGTVTYKVNGTETAPVSGVINAKENDEITLIVTPNTGWIVDVDNVKAESYSTWEAAGARRRSAPDNIQILGDVTLNKSTTAENTWTFTMPAASVLVSAAYQKVSNLAFKPADKTNMMTVKVGDEVKNKDPQDATNTVNIRRVQNVLEGTPVNLTAKTGYKFRKVEVKKGVDYTVDLSTLEANFEAMDGDILYGTTDKTITIPNGAHVTLQGVNITSGAAIVCNGNATITLAAGTENTVMSTTDYNSGIRAGGNNTTLTINGTGKLTVQGATKGAGIGSNRRGVCGNIVIEDGEIITSTGDYGAGIGSGYHGTCGNITIKGGTITATGGICGAGIGSSFDTAICGDILISGGTITANGGIKAAGIGTGSAQQGFPSTCGNITITDGVTSVTATKGNNVALHSIGKGQNVEDKAYCGTVTIGGTVYYDGTDFQNGGSDYLKASPLVYEPGK